MATFKKVIIKGKWWGTYDVIDGGKRTGITIHQDEQGKGDDFFITADVDSRHYFDFEPETRKSLDSAKAYVNRYFSSK